MKELRIEAKTENLETVLDFVETALEGVSMKRLNQILIAVEEVFVNIANYAYSPNSGEALILASVGDFVIIEFEDSGVPYNPLEREAPDMALRAEDRVIGGLGIHMIRNLMDEVTYRRDGNKNILTIKKEKS
ncbi:MAG: ATP-binding protein [Clostridiales bacterium]|jgi:anti-sigma regulatory factor (Ser/Thr protein kinase)|nr:ATP-binding protein [Clostridiales bacterium]